MLIKLDNTLAYHCIWFRDIPEFKRTVNNHLLSFLWQRKKVTRSHKNGTLNHYLAQCFVSSDTYDPMRQKPHVVFSKQICGISSTVALSQLISSQSQIQISVVTGCTSHGSPLVLIPIWSWLYSPPLTAAYKLLPHPLPLSSCRYILSPLPGTPDHCPITRFIWATGQRTLQTQCAAAFSASVIACVCFPAHFLFRRN